MARPNRKPVSPAPAGDDDNLVSLGRRFERLGRRAARLQRERQEEPHRDSAWQAWSSAHDEIELMVKRILRLPATDVAELDIKFAALWFTLYADRPDWPEAKRMANFGRELRRVAVASTRR